MTMGMARRKTRRTTRRQPKTFNLASLAESALIANAVTQGFFNVNLQEFIGTSAMAPNQITARELISGISGGSFGTSVKGGMAPGGYQLTAGYPFTETVRNNLTTNGAAMVGSLIVIPAGFKVFNRLTRKPRSTLNKALKMSGLPLKV